MEKQELATEEQIANVIEGLKGRGIEVMRASSAEEAKQRVLELIPEGAEVMTMTSVTLEESGIVTEINESGRYVSVKAKLAALGEEAVKQKREMGAAPDWAIGSVHAVTEDGEVIVASATGSQLPAYVYGAERVVWVVGTQKIVKDLDAGIARVHGYVLEHESVRVQKAYGMPHSFVAKTLIIDREATPGRITMVLVDEVLGF